MKTVYVLCVLLMASSCRPDTNSTPAPQNAAQAVANRTAPPGELPSVVVILGSSTAFGSGASSYQSAWAGLFGHYLKSGKVINLAKGGYTTYQMLPTHVPALANRPPADTTRNITAALKRKPTVLILSMTTNDVALGHGVDEVMVNLEQVRQVALANGVKRVLITTSMPRRLNAAATRAWVEQRTRILATYPHDAINFFDPLAGTNQLFKPELTPDGIHPNDEGHHILFEQLVQTYTGTRSKSIRLQ